jgi:hypothetical protein
MSDTIKACEQRSLACNPLRRLVVHENHVSMEIRVMRLPIVAMVLVLLSAASIEMGAQRAGGSANDDPIITIDGTKNPELIPQWTVWRTAFEFLAKDDSEQLPTVVLRANTDPQHRALLMKEAKAAVAFDADCNNRVYQREMAFWKEHPDLDIDAVNVKMLEGHMACRRHTLEVRDKVLAGLSPTGAATLSGFVERIKVGWTAQMRKSLVKYYLLPE